MAGEGWKEAQINASHLCTGHLLSTQFFPGSGPNQGISQVSHQLLRAFTFSVASPRQSSREESSSHVTVPSFPAAVTSQADLLCSKFIGERLL